jgi:hypothetical protein
MSDSSGLVLVTAVIACLMASADAGSEETANSPAMAATSSFDRW